MSKQQAAFSVSQVALVLVVCTCIAALGCGIGYGRGTSLDIQMLASQLDLQREQVQSSFNRVRTDIRILRDNVTESGGSISVLSLNVTAQVSNLSEEIAFVRVHFLDGVMNVPGSDGGIIYTRQPVQNGTFYWENNFAFQQLGAYSMDVITLGPLAFQLLIIQPPSPPIVIRTDVKFPGISTFYLIGFEPPISQWIQQQGGAFFYNVVPLTAANVAKVSVSDDAGCFNASYSNPYLDPDPDAQFCLIGGGGNGDSIERNTLRLSTLTDFSVGADYYLQGYIGYRGFFLEDHNFTLSAPWELVLSAF
jgi:hypothetical protein